MRDPTTPIPPNFENELMEEIEAYLGNPPSNAKSEPTISTSSTGAIFHLNNLLDTTAGTAQSLIFELFETFEPPKPLSIKTINPDLYPHTGAGDLSLTMNTFAEKAISPMNMLIEKLKKHGHDPEILCEEGITYEPSTGGFYFSFDRDKETSHIKTMLSIEKDSATCLLEYLPQEANRSTGAYVIARSKYKLLPQESIQIEGIEIEISENYLSKLLARSGILTSFSDENGIKTHQNNVYYTAKIKSSSTGDNLPVIEMYRHIRLPNGEIKKLQPTITPDHANKAYQSFCNGVVKLLSVFEGDR